MWFRQGADLVPVLNTSRTSQKELHLSTLPALSLLPQFIASSIVSFLPSILIFSSTWPVFQDFSQAKSQLLLAPPQVWAAQLPWRSVSMGQL
jgi:long-subunit acyl-CoA synthetase (AMP-forming)